MVTAKVSVQAVNLLPEYRPYAFFRSACASKSRKLTSTLHLAPAVDDEEQLQWA